MRYIYCTYFSFSLVHNSFRSEEKLINVCDKPLFWKRKVIDWRSIIIIVIFFCKNVKKKDLYCRFVNFFYLFCIANKCCYKAKADYHRQWCLKYWAQGLLIWHFEIPIFDNSVVDFLTLHSTTASVRQTL